MIIQKVKIKCFGPSMTGKMPDKMFHLRTVLDKIAQNKIFPVGAATVSVTKPNPTLGEILQGNSMTTDEIINYLKGDSSVLKIVPDGEQYFTKEYDIADNIVKTTLQKYETIPQLRIKTEITASPFKIKIERTIKLCSNNCTRYSVSDVLKLWVVERKTEPADALSIEHRDFIIIPTDIQNKVELASKIISDMVGKLINHLGYKTQNILLVFY